MEIANINAMLSARLGILRFARANSTEKPAVLLLLLLLFLLLLLLLLQIFGVDSFVLGLLQDVLHFKSLLGQAWLAVPAQDCSRFWICLQ